jgi:Zn2+/Cd2+-exporting ATPase
MSETTQTRYRVEGMDCASCASKIDTAVRRMPGVEDVSVSVTAGTMTVSHSEVSDLAAIAKKVTGLGYGVAPLGAKVPASSQGHAGHDYAGHAHDHAAHDHAGHDHVGHDHDHAGHDHAGHDHDHHDHSGHDHAAKPAAGLHGHDHGPSSGPWYAGKKGRLVIVSGASLVAAYAVSLLLPQYSHYLFIAAMLVGLVPIARRAVMAALAGIPFSIEMLMTIAAVGAVIINAGQEAAMVVFLFLVGELLEGVAAGKARDSIKSLTTLVPKTALLEQGSETTEVPAESLKVGAVIVIRPGDRIAADGEIIEGSSTINEASVTGESNPVRKTIAAKVFAGTINGEAVLKVRVTAAASDNTIARIVKLVEEAQESKAPTERFIDKFSRYYTPAVVVVAALVAVLPPLLTGASWSEWVYKALAILLIGCPCALVISTPAAIAAALSAGARRGLLLKGGAVLENLGKITTAAFDKTGTLTEGKPKVTDIVGFGRTEAQVLSRAAALERGSSHPLALSILDRAKADGVPVPPAAESTALPGKGVSGRVGGEAVLLISPPAARERGILTSEQSAQIDTMNGEGKSVSVLIVNDAIAGLIAMRDEPRADARAGIDALKAVGIRSIMLTGDNAKTAAAIAKALGMEPRAELLPEDKQRIVRELQADKQLVAKIGDGINDAPALAAANVGIAMGGGTDVALETADAAVLHGRVIDVANMVLLSRATMSNIHQNITMALGLKVVFLVTTVVGITGLWPAIMADTGATVLVTANAMRLLGWKAKA